MPMKKGARPVARLMSAAMAPQAGTMPPSPGPEASGLVATKRAPLATSRIAWVIAPKL